VLLAGDSVHVNYPAGGQGLQNGMQDAVNLGWRLAQVVNRIAPESLLDTYQGERHPATARSLRHTMAETALQRPGARVKPLRATLNELMATEEPRKQVAALIAGLDIRYDLGDGHPLLGRRGWELPALGTVPAPDAVLIRRASTSPRSDPSPTQATWPSPSEPGSDRRRRDRRPWRSRARARRAPDASS
jgi:FAD binding domain